MDFMDFVNAFWVGRSDLRRRAAVAVPDQHDLRPHSGGLCHRRGDFDGVGAISAPSGFAGAGATVPLTGFGYSLATGVIEAIGEKGFLGVFTGGITAGAAGITAAIVFGYLAAVIFNPKIKK